MAAPIKEVSLKKQKVTKEDSETSLKDAAALLCYYFSQYSYEEALDLDIKVRNRLIKLARRKEGEKYLELVQIASAPHTKKGKGVKDLISKYEKIIRGY